MNTDRQQIKPTDPKARMSWLALIQVFVLLLPIVAIVVMGWKVAREDASSIRAQYQAFGLERLIVVRVNFERWIRSEEQEFMNLLKLPPFNAEEIRQLVFRHPGVLQPFLYSTKVGALYPDVLQEIYPKERDFLYESSGIWSKLFLQPETNKESDRRSGWRFVERGSAIVPWYYNRIADDQIYGFEVNQEWLKESFDKLLVESAPINIGGKEVVLSINQGALRIWGSGEESREENLNIASLPLPEPFDSWRLNVSFPPGAAPALSRATLFNTTSGILLFLFTFLGVAWYAHREQSREMREAYQRVNFVNQVSHELRTPLTNILMYTDILRNREGEHSELQVITQEGERLNRLIGNILSFSTIEHGKIKISREEHQLSELVDEIVAHFTPRLEARGIELKVIHANEEIVAVDREIVTQILYNLVSNIEKYAENQQVATIRTSYAAPDLTIEVSNTGPEIPHEFRGRIFEPFFRVHDTVNEGVSGTGLGLSIARSLAELHGGSVELIDSEGGTTFRVTLSTVESKVNQVIR